MGLANPEGYNHLLACFLSQNTITSPLLTVTKIASFETDKGMWGLPRHMQDGTYLIEENIQYYGPMWKNLLRDDADTTKE